MQLGFNEQDLTKQQIMFQKVLEQLGGWLDPDTILDNASSYGKLIPDFARMPYRAPFKFTSYALMESIVGEADDCKLVVAVEQWMERVNYQLYPIDHPVREKVLEYEYRAAYLESIALVCDFLFKHRDLFGLTQSQVDYVIRLSDTAESVARLEPLETRSALFDPIKRTRKQLSKVDKEIAEIREENDALRKADDAFQNAMFDGKADDRWAKENAKVQESLKYNLSVAIPNLEDKRVRLEEKLEKTARSVTAF